MVINDDSSQSISTAQEGQSEEQTVSTQGWEDLRVQPISPSRLSQLFVRNRRLFRILNILLLIPLIFTLVRLSTIFSSADDQLLIRIGNQGTAIVDLRQNLPISPYLFGANVFPEENTNSVGQEYTGFMNYGPPITSGLQNAHI